jgi:drug/metabolite transporter (DMT)-like permease
MLAILGGLGAALCWAGAILAASRATRLIDPGSLLASVMTLGLLVTAPIAALSGVPENLDAGSAGWLAVSGAGNVVGLLCAYSALRIGKVGLVGPISSTEGAVTAVIAVIAGEQLAPGAGVALAAIAVGVALAAVSRADEDEARRSDFRAALLAAGAALSFGFSLYATGRVGQDLGIAWASCRRAWSASPRSPSRCSSCAAGTCAATPSPSSWWSASARCSASRPSHGARGTGSP